MYNKSKTKQFEYFLDVHDYYIYRMSQSMFFNQLIRFLKLHTKIRKHSYFINIIDRHLQNKILILSGFKVYKINLYHESSKSESKPVPFANFRIVICKDENELNFLRLIIKDQKEIIRCKKT